MLLEWLIGFLPFFCQYMLQLKNSTEVLNQRNFPLFISVSGSFALSSAKLASYGVSANNV